MKSLRITTLILIVLLSTLAFPNFSIVQSETGDVSYFFKSTVRYSNPSPDHVWNFTERGDYDRTIGLFMNNSWQTVELVNSTFPVETRRSDEDNNSVAVLQFPKSALQPSENLNFTVWYHIISKPRVIPYNPYITDSASLNLTHIPQNLVDDYTREEGSWQTSDQRLMSLVLSLKGSETNVLTIVKNFIEWIKEHISYPTDLQENPYYPNQTYSQRIGDCDDQAILLITLCRIVGIPAYLRVGCIYRPSSFDNESVWSGHMSFVERRVGWHGWAVVYVPPWGWLPVDLTFVPEGFGDPLNAIRHGAVTLQNTTQYINVIHTDYVGASLEAREFLVSNDFQVYSEDEMMQEIKQDSNTSDPIPTAVGIDPWVPIALIVLTVFAVFSSVLVFRRLRKRKPERTLPPPPPTDPSL
jgi:transglutaminase-like putative cysteine protease